MNRLTSQKTYFRSEAWALNSTFEYGDDSLLTRMTQGALVFDYSYDSLNRVTTQTVKDYQQQDGVYAEYTYEPSANSTGTTSLIQRINFKKTSNDDILQLAIYDYDGIGRIKSVVDFTGTRCYEYDSLSQLVREDNSDSGKTTVYAYYNGNITSKTEYVYTRFGGSLEGKTPLKTTYYTYDTGFRDKLVSYDGQALTYDTIGNPLSYRDGITMTWQNGRQLASLQNGQNVVSYTYNVNGQRLSKTVNGQTSTYNYDARGTMNRQILPNGQSIWFYSNQDGSVGSINYNYVRYTLLKNAQGDVIGLTDKYGNLVAEYKYDAWGKIVRILDGNGADVSANPNHIANINPLRYRGYYYDNETGFYYLQSRYYDPKICRFINADGYVATGQGVLGNNMFAYCLNNPVMNFDPTGEFVLTAILASITIGTIVKAAVVGCAIGTAIWMTTTSEGRQTSKKVSANIGIAVSDITAQCVDFAKHKEDPDPYARKDQKKQYRERKNKSRQKDDFEDRSGKRRFDPPKKHTPGQNHKKFKIVEYDPFNDPFYEEAYNDGFGGGNFNGHGNGRSF